MSDIPEAVKYAKQCLHWVQEADKNNSPFHLKLALRKLQIAQRHADGEKVPEIQVAFEAGIRVLGKLQKKVVEAKGA